ncbi:MAG: SBBP repeat-containing protein, partial [Flavobacteriales bacterium]
MKKLIPLFLILCCCTITYANGSNDANSLINKTDKRFFIENKGQWEDKVHQLAMLPGLNVWITNTGVVYDFYSVTKTNASDEENKSLINGQVVKVTHLNSNEKPIVKIIDKSKSYVNYITGNTSDKCFANAALSREFLLKNIYPGIDQKWYFENDKIRYDYIVNPHGDYRNIEFSISGATDYFIENNELKFVTVFGTVRIADLFVYQTINNTKVQIKARWKKNKNSISFEVENYDRSKPLIIDPLIWSTFIGGSGDDYANDMTMDALGNIYITGKTSSTNFPTTPGVYSTTLGIGTGVVVSKLSNDGSSLIFSTYITQPTTIPAEAKTIVLDHNNNTIIA